MTRATLVCALCAGAVALAPEAGAQAGRWQCSSSGERTLDPALAEAAREYLGRVEAIYPYQVLGLVRAGDRFYLLNSVDIEWTETTRLKLLVLRLPASYLTPERQAIHAAPGSSPPPGGFVCLAAARAEREGLARLPSGEIVLGAGHSVHFVDPQEPQIAVEVRAAPSRSLNLGEIFLRSARTGIYAGLAGPARQAGGDAASRPPDGTLIIRMASAGGSTTEARVDVPEWTTAAATEPQVQTVAAADLRREEIAVQPAHVPAPRVAPAAIVSVAISVDPPAPVQVLSPPTAAAPVPVAVVTETVPAPAAVKPRIGPAAAGGPSTGQAAAASKPAAGQTYEEYAKAMKTLLALRHSGAVRSVSELTYVHPAVEIIRSQLRR